MHTTAKHRRIHGGFEDDLMIAAVLRPNTNRLVTGNEKLRLHSPALTLNATEAVAYFGLEE